MTFWRSRDLCRLRRAWQSMPEPARAVFDRARFEARTDAEIAAELDIEPDEVEHRLVQALIHLDRECIRSRLLRRGRIWAWLRTIFTRL